MGADWGEDGLLRRLAEGSVEAIVSVSELEREERRR